MKKVILTLACAFIAGFTFAQEMTPVKAEPKKADKVEPMQTDAVNTMKAGEVKPAENKATMDAAPMKFAEPVEPAQPVQPATKSKKAAKIEGEAPKN